MDLFSKKSSNVSNDTVSTPRQMTATVDTPAQTVAVPKEKHSRAFSFVSVLFLLALLTAGVMAYMWYGQKADNIQLNNDISSAKSAQAALQTQVDKLKKQNANLGNAVVDQVANGDTTKSDDDLIKAAVTAREHARKAGTDTKFTISSVRKELPFARASVNLEPMGGYACVLKKADDTWVILFCGQSIPSQTELDIWGVPSTILQ